MSPILTDGSNEFARHTVRTRLPGILDAVIAGDAGLPRPRIDAVRRLREALISDSPLELFPAPAPDWDFWRPRFEAHARRMEAATGAPPRPLNAEWFFLEHYLYRLLIAATDWWANGIDPFAPAKARELSGEAMWNTLGNTLEETARLASVPGGGSAAAADAAAADTPPALAALVGFALWGNRTDLSYGAVAELGHEETDEASLLVNDLSAAWRLLSASRGDAVHIVCDNAATELAADLALADYLVTGLDRDVVLHVKLHPTFVSDATPADVGELVSRMHARRSGDGASRIRELAARVDQARGDGRLRVVPDQYWNGPDFFDAVPPRLAGPFADAALVVLKGDMAYRRLLSDSVPAPTAPLRTVAPAPPAPLLMLRTMKGDPVAGLPAALVDTLDAEDPRWRVNGRRGLIQLLTPPDARRQP